MPQITPQFTYSLEGMLQIVPEFKEDNPEIVVRQEQFLDKLESDYHAEIEVDVDNVTTVEIDVERSLGRLFDPNPETMDRLQTFLGSVSRLLPYYPEDDIDRVFGLELLSGTGSIGVT